MRNAGDSGFYEFAPLDATGMPKGQSFHLPSVTTILNAVPKWLQWWGYELGLAQAQKMALAGADLTSLSRTVLY